MDDFNFAQFLSDNSIAGAGAAIAAALFYKIWRIMRLDHNVDNLAAVEREFRNEMRLDIKGMKEEIKQLHEEKEECHKEKHQIMSEFRKVHEELIRHSKQNNCM
jgi:hypothetical protein